ncbi:ABC transporter ATP-binding protein [Tabrizicola sp. J26]|uniref:ABC transporter ATP-binding protein n=1 Tax=Alitabrizicola rongguiensis TaxID=2909234 RepID=UPI001F2286BA|nr:ABC transporter ATP-binding protein [Tabrizicola rongguiensis]MCF1711125.1 ABC transporter ATP-binding protein [Tabrizicola rongguiensis]
MARITAQNLIKRYGAFQAVHGINFDIADGEFVAILGPSGCGKSSTMRMIAGLESISDGAILFDGRPVNDLRARDRNVAMSFENYALYAPITVYENIAFPLRSAGMDAASIDRAVRSVAEKMELGQLLSLKPGALSSGQAQRVGLARALVRKPAVFLLDEPISHLDTRQRYRMRRFIKSIHQEFGHTMIYVTHDQEEALALADRVMVMSDGLIQQLAAPDEVYTRPANAFVAGFVGEPPINFLDFTDADDRGLTIEGNRVALTEKLCGLVRQIGPRGIAAIRPHFLRLGGGSPVQLRGQGFITEELQDHNEIFVDVGRTRIALVTPPGQKVHRGEDVTVSVDPDHLLLFPAGNKVREHSDDI